ncbi:DUF2058 domain-containing protein [Maricurvus nonylphenolicus]|uniref:DUF2058 domain-containing protein n=1 Tax=Maricurvus nonylphenolicus TaxID=1008307 RepID=UPI0036F2D6D8
MSKSLQDQLLGAGLVDKKKAKQVKKDKRKSDKVQRKSKDKAVDEVKLQAEQARQEKAERDRKLNQERQAAAEEKAIQAQIIQLIEHHRITKQGETAYNFTDGKTIKKIYIDETLTGQLSRGQIALVRNGDDYELVPKVVAEKIAQRNDSFIVVANEKQDNVDDEDDPYADYPIPDDLMW